MKHSLTLLGAVLLQDGSGEVAPLASRRHPLALLALLATAPRHTMGRGAAVGLLWPESSERKARSRLNTCVYQLRRALGEDVVSSVGDELRLDPDGLVCDVVRFREAVDAGDLEKAAGLYGGPFLQGFHLDGDRAFAGRVDRDRARLRRAYHQVLEELADAAEARADPEAASRWWWERYEDDPYDARVACRLMESLSAAGRRARALHVAREHARRLREELEVDSSPEVTDLARRLRTSSEGERPAQRSAGTPVASSARTPVPRAADEPLAETADDAATGAADPAVRERGPEIAGDAPGTRRRGWRVGAAVPALLIVVVMGVALARAAGGSGPGNRSAARELLLQARALDTSPIRGPSINARTIRLYRRALELDPGSAEAWAWLADAFVARAWGEEGRSHWLDSAAVAAEKALALDPELSVAWAQVGDIRWTLGRSADEVLEAYRRAVELNPADPEAGNNLIAFLGFHGRVAEKVAWQRRLQHAAPDPRYVEGLVLDNHLLGRDSVARAWLEDGRGQGYDMLRAELFTTLFHRVDADRTRELLARLPDDDPPNPQGLRPSLKAALALYEGDWEGARRRYRALYAGGRMSGPAVFQGFLNDGVGLALALDRTGQGAEARELAEEVARQARTRLDLLGPYHVPMQQLAVAHLILGDTATALDWLEATVDAGYRDVRMMETIPTLAGLRSHPRFQVLIARAKAWLAEERRRVETEGL